MANTVSQLQALADSPVFQNRVRGAIFQKAVAIVDDVRANGNVNYTAQQAALAKSICLGTQNLAAYYGAMAGSTNVAASTVTYDYDDRQVKSDISDAALQSQVYTVVFQDLI